MYDTLQAELKARLDHIRASGLYKNERVLDTPQHQKVGVYGGDKVLNLCANNYLGLSNHKEVIAAAQDALAKWGYGLSSARFICGTQVIHKDLERQLSDFLRTDDTILYSSCFDANGGLFETLLDSEDAVISDELNHASIIDGIRLSKAQRYRYRHSDMHDLEEKLKQTQGARHRLIATDGVFSMDGEYANLPEICVLAERYRALVMMDDSHAVGFVGPEGRGTHEQQGVIGKIDIITGTLGKALGGASGGYASGRKEIIEYLRQRSRPYLFSNSIAPPIVATSLQVLNLVRRNSELRDRLRGNTVFFRERMAALGFKIQAGDHPIVPIMLGEATLAARMADRLLSKGVYVIAFSFPVVPHGQARIRVQISAAHSREDLEFAARKFAETRAELAV